MFIIKQGNSFNTNIINAPVTM